MQGLLYLGEGHKGFALRCAGQHNHTLHSPKLRTLGRQCCLRHARRQP